MSTDNSLRNNSNELEILLEEIKLLQKEVGENRELIEKLLEQKVIAEKIESVELCDFGECEDNPLSGEVTVTIIDEQEYQGIIKGIFDTENKSPFVKKGTKINYQYLGKTWMFMYLYSEKFYEKEEKEELVHFEPDSEKIISCTITDKYMCSAQTPSNYLATNYAYIDDNLFYNGDFGPNDIDSYDCVEPDKCFVDWIKNQSLGDRLSIDAEFSLYYSQNRFRPIIVD